MARRTNERQRLAVKLDNLNDTEVGEVLDYIAIMESMKPSRVMSGRWDDDLVALLADATENRRARQAFEWESVRRKAERRSTIWQGRA